MILKKLTLLVLLSFATLFLFSCSSGDKPTEQKIEDKPAVVKPAKAPKKAKEIKKADTPKEAQAKADKAADKFKVK
jgi:hypothetical protein